jgi:transposase-like protein
LTPKEGQDKMGRTVIRYSEAFKATVVDELARGRFPSAYEASRAYGIKGCGTVLRWAREYGRQDLLPKVVKVQKPGERSEVKRLKDRVRRLEAALADAHMDKALDHAFLEILSEHTHTDLDAFKKKHGRTASLERGTSCRNPKA